MKDFDIAKFLRENQLGSYGILNHYVDIKPLKEENEDPQFNPEELKKQFEDCFDETCKYGKGTVYHEFFEEHPNSWEKHVKQFEKIGLKLSYDVLKNVYTIGKDKQQEEPVSEEWHPDQTFDAEEMISSAITKLTDAGVSIKQIKQFVDKQLVASADSAVFERKNKF